MLDVSVWCCSCCCSLILLMFSSALRPPDVLILPAPVTRAGEQLMLTCIATVEEFLQATPTLTWRLPGNVVDTLTGLQLTARTTPTITLSFEPLHTSHGGVYECQATVNISGIAPQSQSASQTLRVRSKSFVVVYSCRGYYVDVLFPQFHLQRFQSVIIQLHTMELSSL